MIQTGIITGASWARRGPHARPTTMLAQYVEFADGSRPVMLRGDQMYDEDDLVLGRTTVRVEIATFESGEQYIRRVK